MRRRHRRMVEEAIRNGTWIPPPPETGTFGTGRARVDPSRKPKLWDAYLGTTEKSAQTEWDWESIRPFSASYIAPPPGDATNGANAAGGRAVASAQTPRLSYPQRVTRFFHPDRPEFTAQYQLEARTPATDAAATPNVAGGNEEVVPTPPKQIRVAVLIAMPHRGPERNTGVASSSTAPPRLHVDDDEELPHLEFGVALLDVHDTDEAHHVADADKVEGRRSSASGGNLATFKAQFKGDIVTQDDADYPQAIARWAVNGQRCAKVVAFVKDAEDVSLALKYARSNSLPIAIRGGGHSPAGSSSIEDGLVVGLSRYINGAKVDPEKQLVYVGGGALWEAVDKHGLATVAGNVNHPGIILVVFYNGTEEEGRSKFKAFIDIGPVADLTKEVPYENNTGMEHGQAVYQKGSAHPNPKYTSIAQAYEKLISLSKPGLKVNIVFEYFPLGKVISVPQGTTAFRRDPTPTLLLMAQWEETSGIDTERAREITHEITSIVAGTQTELLEAERFGYGNYDADAVTGRKAKAVFALNYPRLQTIKKRYDPDNIFNKWFAITPA
ncbi:hypothetical protein H0H81_010042 [Sphagnurus paluster]|uniref:FAD-binding PCMH-type domain-containing protein n=1 Tax=Sphagnurus paluster TaxID=117069 RepID=A0A9P7KJU0_9AGAR|nr:hypothetical protein H0H81_010042 [Sphagnurus paluster]